MARALRKRRPPDQERTKPGDQKSPHVGAALPAANERAARTSTIETLMWIKVKTTGPTKQYPDRSLKRYAAVILKALNVRFRHPEFGRCGKQWQFEVES